jgi:hypothetical protein
MELLGDMGQVDAHFGLFGDNVNLSARFAQNVPRAWKFFWPHSMELLVDMSQMKASFGLFGDNVNLDVR